MTENAVLASHPRILKGKHAKFDIAQENVSFEAIGFNMASCASELRRNDRISMVFRVGFNHWLGQERVQLEILDYRKL